MCWLRCAAFLCEGPEESGSGRYGPHYLTDTEVSEDDDTYEDDLDLDISFEEVKKSTAWKPGCFCFLAEQGDVVNGPLTFYLKRTSLGSFAFDTFISSIRHQVIIN